jgi:hypothetical protein
MDDYSHPFPSAAEEIARLLLMDFTAYPEVPARRIGITLPPKDQRKYAPAMKRQVAGVAGVVSLVLGAGFVGQPASGLSRPHHAAANARVLSAVYEGSFNYRIDDDGPSGSLIQTRTLAWVMTIYSDSSGDHRSFVAQGSESTVSSGGYGDSCTISQRAHTTSGPFTIGLGEDPGRVAVSTYVPSDSTDLKVSGGFCDGASNQPYWVLLSNPEPDGSLGTGNPCYSFAAARQFVNPRSFRNLRADSTFTTDKMQVARRSAGCQTNDDIVATRSIHATLRVGSGGPATADPARNGPTAKDRQVVFAVSDLLTTLLRAELPCGYVALGATAAIWATSAGPTAPAALVPAQVLISAGTPLCASYAARIAADIVIANDPPGGNIHRIAQPKSTPSPNKVAAKLASCDSQPSDQKAFCTALRTDAADEIAAADKVAAISKALAKTMDRESKAKKHHKTKALRKQEKAGNKLVTTLQKARLKEDKTWRAISQTISANGVSGHFTKGQDAKAVSKLLGTLKAHGASKKAVKREVSDGLVLRAVDLLAS